MKPHSRPSSVAIMLCTAANTALPPTITAPEMMAAEVKKAGSRRTKKIA